MFRSITRAAVALSAAVIFAASANAAETVVTSPAGTFTNPGPVNASGPGAGFDRWFANNVRAGGSVGISNTYADKGNGSIEFNGPANAKADFEYYFSNPFALSSLTGLGYDFLRASGSTAAAKYSPALRLYVSDGTRTGYLVYEGIYNGQPTAPVGSFTSNDVSGAKFWSTGSLPDAAANYDRTLADWNRLLPNLRVFGLSTGIGSGWDGSFAGAVDEISYTTSFGGQTVFNFETTSVTAAVPEPASWALLILGFGTVGAAARRRRRESRVSFA